MFNRLTQGPLFAAEDWYFDPFGVNTVQFTRGLITIEPIANGRNETLPQGSGGTYVFLENQGGHR